jgi:hypothetical protein
MRIFVYHSRRLRSIVFANRSTNGAFSGRPSSLVASCRGLSFASRRPGRLGSRVCAGGAPAGRFRLYRTANGSDPQLVVETAVLLGEHTYRVDDRLETAGNIVYHLCFTSDSGVEAVLGTILCLEPRDQSRSTVTSPSPHPHALLPPGFGVARVQGVLLSNIQGCLTRGPRPEPERPPPDLTPALLTC